MATPDLIGVARLAPSRAGLIGPVLEQAAAALRDAQLVLGPEPTADEAQYVQAAAGLEERVQALVKACGYDHARARWIRGLEARAR